MRGDVTSLDTVDRLSANNSVEQNCSRNKLTHGFISQQDAEHYHEISASPHLKSVHNFQDITLPKVYRINLELLTRKYQFSQENREQELQER
jgi:hypothetical protein